MTDDELTMVPETKTCSTCGETKPAVEFSKHRHMKHGISGTCLACKRAAKRAWKARLARPYTKGTAETLAAIRQNIGAAQAFVMRSCVPVPESGCWLWEGPMHRKGYGVASVFGGKARASRVSYEAFVGPVPADLYVCHKCDIRSCVNPGHLFLGTARDNALDASSKGRLHGQQNTHCKNGHEYQIHGVRRNGGRLCLICTREYQIPYRIEYARKRRAAAQLTADTTTGTPDHD